MLTLRNYQRIPSGEKYFSNPRAIALGLEKYFSPSGIRFGNSLGLTWITRGIFGKIPLWRRAPS